MSTIEVFNNMEEIEIVFNYKIVLRAKKGTKFSDLSKSFCSQAGILDKNPTYFFGSQKIKSTDNQTLSQLNIQNNSEITGSLEKDKIINVIFILGGKYINVLGAKNTKFSELSKRFCLLANTSDKHPIYIFN